MRQGRTHVALNSYSTPTAAFVKDTQWANPAESCAQEIAAAVGHEGLAAFDADKLSEQLMGDTIYINPMILGYAWQKGWVPLSLEALKRAIELNEVAVANNLAAFEWGRHAAHQLNAVEALFTPTQVIQFKKRDRLEDLIAQRIEFLTAYQNAAYAKRYEIFVLSVKAKEQALGKTLLTETVAKQLFKLMAYKDEYEVARLHTDKQFLERVKTQFEGDFKVFYHLAPPLLAKRNEKGHLIKQKMSPATLLIFKVLAKFKFLRGTALDIFGRTEERQTERALVQEYMDAVTEVLTSLKAENHALAVQLGNVPEQIRGFGHVKERNLIAAMVQWQKTMDAFRQTI
jgi:indolepyruvate ferredoxin oxidoreductase